MAEDYAAMAAGFRTKPHNIEAEQAVLGAILINNLAYHEIASIIRPEDFYEPVHGQIFGVMGQLIERERTADPVTLIQVFANHPTLCQAMGGDGRQYLSRIAYAAETIVTARDYATMLADLAGRRALIEITEVIANRAANEASVDSFAQQLNEGMGELQALQRYVGQDLWRPLSAVISAQIERISSGQDVAWSTGLETLDRNMGGGLRPASVYGIEARFKAFKTGVLGTIAYGLLRQSVPFLFAALEMGSARILERLVAAETGCNALRFRSREQPQDLISRLKTFDSRFGASQGFFADEPGLNFTRMRGLLSEAVMKLGVRVVLIDYWQLITGKQRDQSQADFLTEVAQWIAAFAAKENVAVIIASQSNREGESFGSDGLAKACDWLAQLHKVPRSSVSLGDHEALWFELRANRDGPDGDIGNAENPPFRIDKRGPVLRDLWAEESV